MLVRTYVHFTVRNDIRKAWNSCSEVCFEGENRCAFGWFEGVTLRLRRLCYMDGLKRYMYGVTFMLHGRFEALHVRSDGCYVGRKL